MSDQFVTVKRVAGSPDEFDLLSRIVDNFANDAYRLDYAEWLDKRGDVRGKFLRQFVEASQNGRQLPELHGLPSDWADMVGVSIIEKIHQSECQQWQTELLSVARSALRIESQEADFDYPPPTPDTIGLTRLGGDPDLPIGATYPTATDGRPLHFLSQFNLEDLQGTIAGRAFPKTGLMSIFRTQVDDNYCACYIDEVDFPRLVSFTSKEKKLVRISRPENTEEKLAPFRLGMHLIETMRLPASPHQWPNVTLPEQQYEKLDNVFPTNLGGTAYILLGHVTHGNIGEEPLKDRADWVQLILVPYFEGPDYGITDMSLSYQLPASDLLNGRFDRLESTFG